MLVLSLEQFILTIIPHRLSENWIAVVVITLNRGGGAIFFLMFFFCCRRY
jgi:hypothetical protein